MSFLASEVGATPCNSACPSVVRQFVREHLEVDDRDFPLWLAHKTALEGVPDNDEILTTQKKDNQHTDKRIS